LMLAFWVLSTAVGFRQDEIHKLPKALILDFFRDIKFRKIIKRLAKNPELVAAAKDPSMIGNPKWRRIVDKQLTDEEKAFIKKNFYDRGKIRTGLGGPSFKK
jgi:hypothetical protein